MLHVDILYHTWIRNGQGNKAKAILGHDGGLHSPLIRPCGGDVGDWSSPSSKSPCPRCLVVARSTLQTKTTSSTRKTTKTHTPDAQCISMYGIFTNIWREAGGLHFSNQSHHDIFFMSVKQAIPLFRKLESLLLPARCKGLFQIPYVLLMEEILHQLIW